MSAKELAHALGISPSTLSLILNNKPGISDRLRSEVLKKISDMEGYELPDRSSSFIRSTRKTIFFITYLDSGKLLGADTNTFFSFIVEGIESQVRAFGYTLMCVTIRRENLEAELAYIAASNCAGFIIFAPELAEEQLYPFLSLNLPFVLLENSYEIHGISSVSTNNREGIQAAFNYLVEAGHKKIGYLASGLNYNCFLRRQLYAQEFAKQKGFYDFEQYVFSVGYPDASSYEGTKELLSQKTELPSAFLTDCDAVAVGAIKAFKENGFSVPEDISFIGFDNLPLCNMLEPPLTTVHIHKDTLGTEAIHLLFRLINGTTDCSVKTELSTKLIVRNSVLVRQ